MEEEEEVREFKIEVGLGGGNIEVGEEVGKKGEVVINEFG